MLILRLFVFVFVALSATAAWAQKDERSAYRLEIKPEQKAWFSAGGHVGTVTVQKTAAGTKSTVLLGEKRIDLDFEVRQVLNDIRTCVFVGQEKLAIVQLIPSVELLRVRSILEEGRTEVLPIGWTTFMPS
jgi:hypothetical protein